MAQLPHGPRYGLRPPGRARRGGDASLAQAAPQRRIGGAVGPGDDYRQVGFAKHGSVERAITQSDDDKGAVGSLQQLARQARRAAFVGRAVQVPEPATARHPESATGREPREPPRMARRVPQEEERLVELAALGAPGRGPREPACRRDLAGAQVSKPHRGAAGPPAERSEGTANRGVPGRKWNDPPFADAAGAG